MQNREQQSDDQKNKDVSAKIKTRSPDYAEGRVAKAIEQQTAKLPSDTFLWAAGASVLGSLAMQLMGKRQISLFVGQWVPTFLAMGLYNKIVKVAGSDRVSENDVIH